MKIKPQEPQQHESDFQNQKDKPISTESYFLMTLSTLLTMETQIHFSQAQALWWSWVFFHHQQSGMNGMRQPTCNSRHLLQVPDSFLWLKTKQLHFSARCLKSRWNEYRYAWLSTSRLFFFSNINSIYSKKKQCTGKHRWSLLVESTSG